MTITYAPEVEELDTPQTETQTQRRTGGWSPRPQPRIGLDLGSDDEMLLIENNTTISWSLYKDFHQLGIIDPGELLVFHLCKRGMLNVRPINATDIVEYLVLPLNYFVNQVFIYTHFIEENVEVYDLRAS